MGGQRAGFGFVFFNVSLHVCFAVEVVDLREFAVGEFGGVGEGGPDDMLDASSKSCVGHGLALGEFFGFVGEFPVVGYAEDGVGAIDCVAEGVCVV